MSATSIYVSWSTVPPEHQHGVIEAYVVFYRESGDYSAPYKEIASTEFSTVIIGLEPATSYGVRILAYTRNGNGVASIEIAEYTHEKGRVFGICKSLWFVCIFNIYILSLSCCKAFKVT